jgi:sterol 3beta-glucosyltransferase
MKILISSFGARGDVQPYLALAVGLQQVGHSVTLATSATFSEWIQSYGVQTQPTCFNLQEVMQQLEVQAALRGKNLVRQFQLLRGVMRQTSEILEVVWSASAEAELIIQSPTGCGVLEAAALRGVPTLFASLVPIMPTRAFPTYFER